MSRILVVDDVATVAEQYAYDLRRLGDFRTRVATGGEEALEVLSEEAVDCVVLDLEMPGTDGFAVLEAMRERRIEVPVVVYTGTGDFDRCVRAMRLGAYGFVDKSESMRRVLQEVRDALRTGRLRSEVRRLRARLDSPSGLVGESPAMRELAAEIRRLAPVPSAVLVLGESGTGKELVARELHRLRAGEDAPFVAVNSAALPESLVESELFGHEKGAFTGADRLRMGAFEAAGEGTLFLDEVGELPPAAQAKLLRVLEQRALTRVGGTEPVAVEARVVAATHRDLEADVAEGRFRQDLFYRLNVHVLRVPALRERRSDVPALVRHFLESLSARFGMPVPAISPGALDALSEHDWRRNNVRELRNAVERLLIAAGGGRIEREDLPAELRAAGGDGKAARGAARSWKERKEEAERRILLEALERHEWQITRTAEALGLADHASLLKIMRRHGISRD